METTEINEIRKIEVPEKPGTPLGGGFYIGTINVDGQHYALVLSPKELGQYRGKWGEWDQKIIGADSVADGFKSTLAMADAGSQIARNALDIVINGQTAWYIPARDELEMIYRHFKPTEWKNCCSWRDGENASAVPPTAAYTEELPEQVEAPEFQEDGAEAMSDDWYWTSTQVSAYNAAIQDFSYGLQHYRGKNGELRVRVVRRLKIV